VDRQEAKVRFQDADRLFRAKQYEQAVRILNELNAEFPDERHVLYPLARGLTGLKRFPEAREIAERLVNEFHYGPAQELIDRIDRRQTFENPDVETPTLPSGLDDIMLTPASFGAGPPPLPGAVASESTWQPYALWIGLVSIGFIALVGITLTLGRPVVDYYVDYFQNFEEYASNPGSEPPLPLASYLIVSLASSAYSWVICSLCGYVAIRIVGSLRFDDFGEDMKDVGLYTLYIFLMLMVPGLTMTVAGEMLDPEESPAAFLSVIGFALLLMLAACIGALVLLKMHWELTFGKLVGVVVLFIVFSSMASSVYVFAYFTVIAVLSS
jgi:hypothetical protein